MASKKGYWVQTIDGKTTFLNESTGWEVLVDGKVLRFHKKSAEEHITSSFALCNVIQWWYGEKR